MTGHGWVWPIDENGDPIGAPTELRDVKLLGATREGEIAFDAERSPSRDWGPNPELDKWHREHGPGNKIRTLDP